MIDLSPIRERFSGVSQHLNERERRLLAATEARAAGYGGIAAVSQATGIAACRATARRAREAITQIGTRSSSISIRA
jgi:hypothetical protein